MTLYANSRVDTVAVDPVISAVSMMITHAMIVNSDCCTLKEYLVCHGSIRLSRPVPPGARSVSLSDVLCGGHLCMDCEYLLAKCPTPGGGGDPWAAPA